MKRIYHIKLFASTGVGLAFVLLLILLGGSFDGGSGVRAGGLERPRSPVTMALAPTEPYSQYLPFIATDYCPAVDQVPSPFSIQIASLDQVVEPTNRSATRRQMTEAEWVAVYSDTFPTVLDALEASGAGWTRVRINWGWIQPEPTEDYVWGPYHDEKLALVGETGLQMIGIVDSAPDWAAATPCAPISSTSMVSFTNFLTELVTRYSQAPYNIHHWELFNEPDGVELDMWQEGLGCWGNDGDQYAQMLSQAYGVIKAADPGATVIMGGIAYDNFTEWGGVFNRYFPDDVMANGGDQYLDALNFHYFPDFHAEWERWVPWGNPPTCGVINDGAGTTYEGWGRDLVAKTNHYRSRMATCLDVDLPIWMTELAEHGYPGNEESLTQQARYVIQGYVRGLSAGVVNITWYALTTPNDPYEQSLLYNDDLSPKPAFYAYQTMATELDGYEYSYDRNLWERDDEAPLGFTYTREAYVFQTPCGREKTVAWGSTTLAFTGASALRVVDRSGVETRVVDGGANDADGSPNGVVTLALSADPVFVELE